MKLMNAAFEPEVAEQEVRAHSRQKPTGRKPIPENLPRVLAAGARLVGVNNRDLRTFTTSLEHTLRLARDLPSDVCLVSESGIRTREDVLRLGQAGVRAVLVGESLMRSPDIGRKLDELRGIPPDS